MKKLTQTKIQMYPGTSKLIITREGGRWEGGGPSRGPLKYLLSIAREGENKRRERIEQIDTSLRYVNVFMWNFPRPPR